MLYCNKDFVYTAISDFAVLYCSVCINLSFIHFLCRYSLLVAFILCRANICQTSTELETSYRKLIENYQCFAFFVCKVYNFLHTRHCRIKQYSYIFENIKFICTCFETGKKSSSEAIFLPVS